MKTVGHKHKETNGVAIASCGESLRSSTQSPFGWTYFFS
jgi:hypothetical protein